MRGRPSGDGRGGAGRDATYGDGPESSRPDDDPGRDGAAALAVVRQVLDRFLDRGLVINGEFDIDLPGIGPVTLRPRLVIAPADTAQRPGTRWERDKAGSAPARSPKAKLDDRSPVVSPKPHRPGPEGWVGRRSLDPTTEFVGDHPVYREEDG